MLNRTPITKEAVKRVIALGIRGRSTGEVAHSAGVSKRTVNDWAGERAEPHATQLVALMAEYDEIHEAVMFMAGRKPATLTDDQMTLIRQALDLLGTAIPAITSPPQKVKSCPQSSFPFTNGASQTQLLIQRLATVQ